MTKDQKKKYTLKAKYSFKTKKNLFLFDRVIIGKASFTKEEFHDFKISKELVNKFAAEYWQQHLDYSELGLKISEIEKRIRSLEFQNIELLKELEAEYVDSFPNVYPVDKFEKLLNEKNCHYCGVTIEQIEKISDNKKIYKKNLRGWSLEIDRINSNFEYSPENCVISCYWCNNAKTDEFTESEFLRIGKVIGEIWEERLQGINNNNFTN